KRLADQAGFRYVYDSQTRQYAHPSGVIVLTPKAKISLRLWGEIGCERTARRACCSKGREIVVNHLAGLSALLPLQSHHREIRRADPGDLARRQPGICCSNRVVGFFGGASISRRERAN